MKTKEYIAIEVIVRFINSRNLVPVDDVQAFLKASGSKVTVAFMNKVLSAICAAGFISKLDDTRYKRVADVPDNKVPDILSVVL
jgi:hypothetical protein